MKNGQALALAPAGPAVLGGIKYDGVSLKKNSASRLFVPIGCVHGADINGFFYDNIAPTTFNFGSNVDYESQNKVWFGLYVTAQAISFNRIDLEFRMVYGTLLTSQFLDELILYLTGKSIAKEDDSFIGISDVHRVANSKVVITLKESFTIDSGPHWFKVVSV